MSARKALKKGRKTARIYRFIARFCKYFANNALKIWLFRVLMAVKPFFVSRKESSPRTGSGAIAPFLEGDI